MSANSRCSSSGAASSSPRSSSIWRSNSSRWARMDTYSPAPMEKAPARRPATPARSTNFPSVCAPANPMMSAALETRPSLTPKVLALVGSDRPRRLVLGHVGAVGAGLHAAHDRQHGADAEAAGEEADEPDAEAGAALAGLDAGLTELVAPDVGVALLDGAELLEDGAPFRVGLGLGEEAVDGDTVNLVVEVGLVAADVVRGGGALGLRLYGHTAPFYTLASQAMSGVPARAIAAPPQIPSRPASSPARARTPLRMTGGRRAGK